MSAAFLIALIGPAVGSLSAQSAAGNPAMSAKAAKAAAKRAESRKKEQQKAALKYRASLTPAKINTAQEGDIQVLIPEHRDVSPSLDVLITNKGTFPTEAPREMRDGRRELFEFDDQRFLTTKARSHANFTQTSTPEPSALVTGASFEGPGSGFPGYSVIAIPPDTTMAVGPNHIVAWVNSHLVIYDKAGTVLLPGSGFITGNTLWAGFGGVCETTNRGDPIVQYDRIADRWVFSQFAFSTSSGNPVTPYRQCFAVSTGPNPAGPYNRYSYSFDTAGPGGNPAFNDYGKIGIWNDGYYVSYNAFGGSPAGANVGVSLCAYDRTSMLAGGPGVSVCAPTTFYGGGAAFIPADLEGTTLPTDTTRGGLFLRQSNVGALRFLRLKPDFVTPANTTINNGYGGASGSVINLPTPGINRACNGGGGACVAQPATAVSLDTLGDRMMYRLSYRNRAGVDSLVVTHSVDPDGAGGLGAVIQWYEIRNPLNDPAGANPPVIYQSGTFNPDATNRWMGSAAMNGDGDILIGYSRSSGTVSPGIAVAGRKSADPLNTLQAEVIAQAGAGSQTGFSRWGDYTTMQVDPSDDKTFWFIGQYYSATSGFNWRTRIVSFSFPPPNSTPTISASGPLSVTEAAPAATQQIATVSDADQAANTLSVTVNGGSSATVNGVTVSGITISPAGAVSASISAACNAANASFTLRVTDSIGAFSEATLTVNVIDEAVPPVIDPIANVIATLPPGPSTAMPVTFPLPTATDNCGPVTVTTSPVSGSVFNVGVTTVNVTAVDGNGNTSTASFTVTVLFPFGGFTGRIVDPPTVNFVIAGNTIPIVFSLGGDRGTNIFQAGSPRSQQVNCLTGVPIGPPVSTIAPVPLFYGGSNYYYYWKTSTSWKGTCRQFQMALIDSSVRTANIRFYD